MSAGSRALRAAPAPLPGRDAAGDGDDCRKRKSVRAVSTNPAHSASPYACLIHAITVASTSRGCSSLTFRCQRFADACSCLMILVALDVGRRFERQDERCFSRGNAGERRATREVDRGLLRVFTNGSAGASRLYDLVIDGLDLRFTTLEVLCDGVHGMPRMGFQSARTETSCILGLSFVGDRASSNSVQARSSPNPASPPSRGIVSRIHLRLATVEVSGKRGEPTSRIDVRWIGPNCMTQHAIVKILSPRRKSKRGTNILRFPLVTEPDCIYVGALRMQTYSGFVTIDSVLPPVVDLSVSPSSLPHAQEKTMRSSLNRKATRMTMAVALLAVTAQAAAAQAKRHLELRSRLHRCRRGRRIGRPQWRKRVIRRTVRARHQGASRDGQRHPRYRSLGRLLLVVRRLHGYSWSYKYIPIGVTANYHFKLDEPKIDPFVGLGLGYNVISCSVTGTFNGDCGYSSGIYAIARAGARYFFSPKMAVYGDVGAGGGRASTSASCSK